MAKTEERLHLVAGRAALAAVSRLLGLKLTALCGLGGKNLRLGLRHGELDLAFYILPKDSAEAVLKTPGLALGCEGDAGPAQKRFLQVMAAKLGKRTFQDVLRLIAQDPESFSEPESFGPYGVTLSAPIAAGPIGLQGGGWRNFFGDQDFEVLLGYPELSLKKTLYARYSDRECLYSWAGNDPRKYSFFAYPVRCPSESFGATVFRKGIVMELGEHDMILGSNTKADAMVQSVAREAARSPGEFVVFNQFCTTTVLGEDASAVTDRLGKESGRTAVSWSHSDRDQLDNFGRFFKGLFDRPDFFTATADPDAVNLFHFPPDYREAELVPFLEELGLKANLRLFPDVDFSAVASLPRAQAQVFCEASSYQAKLKELLAKSPRPVVEAPAPFGLAGTRKCLAAVAAATGRAAALDKL
ncbi:MAG: nitrogenase component 1, partial [Elusimicrobia bacterium]|nr:nitrogenase component 1 [Elusimicrobiota bacterium]